MGGDFLAARFDRPVGDRLVIISERHHTQRISVARRGGTSFPLLRRHVGTVPIARVSAVPALLFSLIVAIPKSMMIGISSPSPRS